MRINDGGGGVKKTPTKPLPIPQKDFKELDANKDGKLTGTELKGVKRFDGDGDKVVTKDEFKAGVKAAHQAETEARRDKAFNKADLNNDGILTGKEKAAIKKFDQNGDGEISKEEFVEGKKEAWRQKVDQKFDDVFNKLDITNEGVLSGTEAKKHKDWDADGDGKITKEEAKAGWTADRKEARENQMLNGGKLDEIYRLGEKKEKKDDKKEKADKN